MDKYRILALVVVLVTVIIVLLLLSQSTETQAPSGGLTEDYMRENPGACNADTDCTVKLNQCSCKNMCENKYYTPEMTCARACLVDQIDTTIDACSCVNNECAPV